MTGHQGRDADVRLRAWTDFVLSYNGLTAVLEREMRDETGITLSQYDVLLRLAEAPGGRLKMTDLAQAIVYSTGGLTRLSNGCGGRAWCGASRRSTTAG